MLATCKTKNLKALSKAYVQNLNPCGKNEDGAQLRKLDLKNSDHLERLIQSWILYNMISSQ